MSEFSEISETSDYEDSMLTDIPYISWDLFPRESRPMELQLDYIFDEDMAFVRTSNSDSDVLIGINYQTFMSGNYGWIDVRFLYF